MRRIRFLYPVFLAVPLGLAQAQPAQQAGPPSQLSGEARARTLQMGTPTLRMEVSRAHAANARSLLARCEEIRAARLKGVNTYVVDQSTMNNRALVPYERMEIRGSGGKTYPMFRQSREAGPFSSDQLRLFAKGAGMVGEGLDREMASAGFPNALMGGESPWATTDPQMMMGGASTFLNAAADAQEANAREKGAAAGEEARSRRDMAEFASRAKLVGTEKIGTRDAYLLEAQGLKRVLPAEDGQQMTVDDIALWIDAEHCVPLKMTIDGVVRSEGKDKPVLIERFESRYRPVPGSDMFEPFRLVMRIKGAMTAEQERQLQESRRQLEELDARLAQMPPEQRRMMMSRVGGQIQMLRNMAEGGGVSVSTRVHAIHVNPDAATLKRLQASTPVGPGAGSARQGMR